VLDVVAVDLGELGVALRAVVAVHHEPVLRLVLGVEQAFPVDGKFVLSGNRRIRQHRDRDASEDGAGKPDQSSGVSHEMSHEILLPWGRLFSSDAPWHCQQWRNSICERLGRQWELPRSWLLRRVEWPRHSPAALRSAALIRSCQPGPSSWKKSSTSRSMRSVTCSLALGIAGFAVGSSAGLVVAALKAASAASRGSLGRRGRLLMADP